MSETKFTKGPWETAGIRVYAPGAIGANICEISEPRATKTVGHTRLEFGSADASEAYANLHLIRTAPELYEALETTAGNIRSLGPAGALDQVPMPYREWLAVVDAILAKARGETP